MSKTSITQKRQIPVESLTVNVGANFVNNIAEELRVYQTPLDRPEPFNPHAASLSPSSPGFSGQVSQPTTSGGAFDWTLDQSSMQNPTSSSPPPLHLSDNMTQVRTGKAALMAQQYQNAPQSTQHMDFGENGEQEPRLLRLPSVSPPSYTHR